MPKYRWATERRHGYWHATRREALDSAVKQGWALRSHEIGDVVLREGVWIEQQGK